MTAIKVLQERFAKATVSLTDVEAERDFKLSVGALLSVIDDETDPLNFILVTVRQVASPNGG